MMRMSRSNWRFGLGCFWSIMALLWGISLTVSLTTGHDAHDPATMGLLSLILANQAFREARNA